MTRVALMLVLSFILAACGGGGGGSAPAPTVPTPPTPPPPQRQSPDLTQNKLLTNAELRTESISASIIVDADTAAWVTQNSFPIRSVTYDLDFSDLSFLTAMIGDKPIVQLGESTHGSKEFNHIKTRMIKFLHQNMGFNVVAFESGFFGGLYVDDRRATFTADQSMNYIFSIWHTNEVYELFRYIRETQSTSQPIRLIGFDTQISSSYYAFIGSYIDAIPDEAGFDSQTRDDAKRLLNVYRASIEQYSSQNCFSTDSTACDDIRAEMAINRDGLNSVTARLGTIDMPSRRIKELYIIVSAATGQIDHLTAARAPRFTGEVRDLNMAKVFTSVKTDLFPDDKIVIWAHNRHIANEQSETLLENGNFGFPDVPMGFHLKQTYGDDLFTIGLYMLRGEVTDNSRRSIAVITPRNNSLEAIAHAPRLAALYIDTRKTQSRESGNDFIFERISAYYWGGSYGNYSMIPSDQFDGIIVIDQSSAPSYR